MSDERAEVTITHHVQGQGGRYVARVPDAEESGYLEWEPRPGIAAADGSEPEVRVATHTVVPRPIGGRGVAAQLVERLVADAREKGFRIAPQCSYVADKFSDNPDWSDLRA